MSGVQDVWKKVGREEEKNFSPYKGALLLHRAAL